MKTLIKFLSKVENQVIVIVAITFLVYANSLFNKIVWDDHLFLENWPAMQNFQVGEILRGSAPPAQDKIWRPLRGIIWAIDYKLWKVNPFFYHLQAFLVHLSVTVLVFFIARELYANFLRNTPHPTSPLGRGVRRGVGTKEHGNSNDLSLRVSHGEAKQSQLSPDKIASPRTPRNDMTRFIPLIVALIFGVHPIHTETIDYISASVETIGSLFFFLAFYGYIASDKIKDEAWSMMAKVGSVAAAFAAFFTYEMTLTLPLMLVLYEVCFGKGMRGKDKQSKFPISNFPFGFAQGEQFPINFQFLIRVVPYFAGAGAYVFVRVFVLHILARNEYLGYSFLLTMAVMVKVFVRYILLLFVPFNQTAIHNLVGDFPASMLPYDKLDSVLSQTIFDFDVLASAAILVGALLVAVRYFFKKPLLSFGILWFFIALLPVSYIIPMGGAMAEKYLYIASFGFIFALAAGLSQIAANYKQIETNVLIYGLVGAVLFYGVATVARNAVWKNDITLFSDVAKKSPSNLLANYNLGIWYANERDYQQSALYYQRAIEKAPEFWEARYNLANIYLKFGKGDLAKEQYTYVLKVNPKYLSARNILDNLGPLQQATTSAVPVSDELFTPYTTKGGLKFWFPIFWSLKEEKGKINLGDINTPLQVEIYEAKAFLEKDAQGYVDKQKEILGTLVNGGPAQIPNVDNAYVKVWNKTLITPNETDLTETTKSAQVSNNQQNQVVVLQFFLFKGKEVVEIRVWPADFIKVNGIFDQILSTLDF